MSVGTSGRARWFVLIGLAASVGACGGGTSGVACAAGTTRSCACADETLGQQTCLANAAAWSKCDCESDGTGGAAGASHSSGTGGTAGGGISAPDCAAELSAKAETYEVAVASLVEAAAEIRARLAVGCFNIASDLGDDSVSYPGDGRDATDEDVSVLCETAAVAIEAEIEASRSISVEYEPPRCQVGAEAQLSCEADCSMDSTCEGGLIEARCIPSDLRVIPP